MQSIFISLPLIGPYLGQDRPETLVRHDVRLGDASEFLEGAERESPAIVPNLDPAGGVRVDPA